MLHANTSEVATVAIVRSTKTNALMGLCLFSGEDLTVCNRFQASTRTASNTLHFMIIYCHGVPLQKCLCNRLGDQTTFCDTDPTCAYIHMIHEYSYKSYYMIAPGYPSIHPSIHPLSCLVAAVFFWVQNIQFNTAEGAKPGLARCFLGSLGKEGA